MKRILVILAFFILMETYLPKVNAEGNGPDYAPDVHPDYNEVDPAPTETWWKSCLECSANPVTTSCVTNGKETYIPKILFEIPFKHKPDAALYGFCVDRDGLIYFLYGGAEPVVEIRTPEGKIDNSFAWKIGNKDSHYEIKVDEKKNILIFPHRNNDVAQIYNQKGIEIAEFKVGAIYNIGSVWIQNGIVFSMNDGDVLYRLKSSLGKADDYSANTLKNYHGYVLGLPPEFNHGKVQGLTFVDDAGNLYALYEADLNYGTYTASGHPRSDFRNYVCKIDKNMNLLSGFQFEPGYIEPSSEAVYVLSDDPKKKTVRIIQWSKAN